MAGKDMQSAFLFNSGQLFVSNKHPIEILAIPASSKIGIKQRNSTIDLIAASAVIGWD